MFQFRILRVEIFRLRNILYIRGFYVSSAFCPYTISTLNTIYHNIANAALAVRVAIGSTCDMTTPGYALLIGIAAGALSVIGYSIIAPKLQKLIKGSDTCGINNLHGMPGILGGGVAIFITGNAGTQLLGIVTTVCVAFIGGKITGVVINLLGRKEIPYSDEDEFCISPQI